MSSKRLDNIAGWLVFLITATVFFFSAERTGSLWDCGEFILGANKLEVVHPPGAPLFMLIGRLFTFVAEIFSSNPESIAFSINLMSGLSTAAAAMFVCWITIMLGKMALVGRGGTLDNGQRIANTAAGVVAGLTTAFCTSIWFSAVEGEVYAMSTFFTAMTLWSMIKWYTLPDTPNTDKWLIFTIYSAGLSIGVHLLSLLTFPALALFYYFKKYKNPNLLGMGVAAAAGVAFIVVVQSFIITGIPKLWAAFELFMVNNLGMPFHSGLIPVVLLIGAAIFFGLRYAHKTGNALLQNAIIAATMVIIGFSTIGIIVIRANANTPVNMNAPSDAMRLIPYINREQYGERALLYGPHFDAKPIDTEVEDRYGRVGDKYEIVEQKLDYVYKDSDKMLFPRMGDYSQGRPGLYRQWINKNAGTPSMGDNLSFMFNYQFGWMYWRYFMWNFAGRQNGEQGYYSWDKSSGHWLSGITPFDEVRLHNMSELPESMKNHKARNFYFMLPFLFGILGMVFHVRSRDKDFMGLFALFIITGIGIIIYSNQPPNEPRERDYVLAGSFFTYAIWVGMGVLALFNLLREKAKLDGNLAAIVSAGIVLAAPLLMGFQNFDDHSRRLHTGARDYASNFLESCEPNAIIFTYGDNDTYPLWYAQEVEGIRTDVRVVNLSLIAVDWYIDQLRRKVNDSAPIKMTIPRESYRGYKRNQTPYFNQSGQDRPINLQGLLKFIGEEHPLRAGGGRTIESYYSTKQVFIPVNKQQVLSNGTVSIADTARIVNRIDFKINKDYLIKDELAILDVIASNLWERPIYFAVTCRPEKMFGLQDYMELEGLGLRIIPVKSQTDRAFGTVIGAGRVDTDAVYQNVMEEYKWGNFDKHDLFVDRSYMPSVQSHRMVMLRTARAMLAQKDTKRAVDIANKYFEAFPHKNFPYDYNTIFFINILIEGGDNENAKKHLDILATETLDQLEFFYSLGDDLEQGFEQDFGAYMQTKDGVINAAKMMKDQNLVQQYETMFQAYQIEQPRN